MIAGVEIKALTTNVDDSRGFFREVIRVTDEFFSEGFGQWSHSLMYAGVASCTFTRSRWIGGTLGWCF